MKKSDTFSTVFAFMLILSMLLAACAPVATSAPTEEPTEGGAAAPKKNAGLEKVIYVTPGTLGDNAFTDAVNLGLIKIKSEYGSEIKVIENSFDSSKYAQSVEAAFGWGPNVLYTDAYGMEDMVKQYADNNPDIKVVNLDFVLQNDKKTISSITFIQEEGAFMAGVVAALVTTSNLEFANPEKVVGAMGGQDMWVIRSFMNGFEQGVKYVDPEIKVVTNFAGTFSDPAKGKAAAKQLFAQGADVVFQIAGLTGNGALEAAAEDGKYVIGVDSNQNSLYPGHVLTSMVKDLGGAAYDIYSKMVDGTYAPDKTYEYGYGPNGVYLAIDSYTTDILTPELLAKVKEIEGKLISGDIVVDRYPIE